MLKWALKRDSRWLSGSRSCTWTRTHAHLSSLILVWYNPVNSQLAHCVMVSWLSNCRGWGKVRQQDSSTSLLCNHKIMWLTPLNLMVYSRNRQNGLSHCIWQQLLVVTITKELESDRELRSYISVWSTGFTLLSRTETGVTVDIWLLTVSYRIEHTDLWLILIWSTILQN